MTAALSLMAESKHFDPIALFTDKTWTSSLANSHFSMQTHSDKSLFNSPVVVNVFKHYYQYFFQVCRSVEFNTNVSPTNFSLDGCLFLLKIKRNKIKHEAPVCQPKWYLYQKVSELIYFAERHTFLEEYIYNSYPKNLLALWGGFHHVDVHLCCTYVKARRCLTARLAYPYTCHLSLHVTRRGDRHSCNFGLLAESLCGFHRSKVVSQFLGCQYFTFSQKKTNLPQQPTFTPRACMLIFTMPKYGWFSGTLSHVYDILLALVCLLAASTPEEGHRHRKKYYFPFVLTFTILKMR